MAKNRRRSDVPSPCSTDTARRLLCKLCVALQLRYEVYITTVLSRQNRISFVVHRLTRVPAYGTALEACSKRYRESQFLCSKDAFSQLLSLSIFVSFYQQLCPNSTIPSARTPIYTPHRGGVCLDPAVRLLRHQQRHYRLEPRSSSLSRASLAAKIGETRVGFLPGSLLFPPPSAASVPSNSPHIPSALGNRSDVLIAIEISRYGNTHLKNIPQHPDRVHLHPGSHRIL